MKPLPKAVIGPQEVVLIDTGGLKWAGMRVIDPPTRIYAVKAPCIRRRAA